VFVGALGVAGANLNQLGPEVESEIEGGGTGGDSGGATPAGS
jgi:hypothetical protein